MISYYIIIIFTYLLTYLLTDLLLVIVVIVTNKKMRHSATNLFIANLAVADLVITIRRLSAPIVSTEHAITGSCD